VLKDRGADPSAGISARAKASEKTVYEALVSQGGPVRSREQLSLLMADLEVRHPVAAAQLTSTSSLLVDAFPCTMSASHL
jgi:hypothetical protein